MLGKDFKFHSSLKNHSWLVKKLPKYSQEVVENLSQNLSCKPKVPLTILSQFLRFNNQILVNSDKFSVDILLIKTQIIQDNFLILMEA